MGNKSERKKYEKNLKAKMDRVLYRDIDEYRYFFKKKTPYPERNCIETCYYDWKGKIRKQEIAPTKNGPAEHAWVSDRKGRMCFFIAKERPARTGVYDIEIIVFAHEGCTAEKKAAVLWGQTPDELNTGENS